MFTGLVQEIGAVMDIRRTTLGVRYTVRAPRSVPELQPGDSISVGGVCQTVEAVDREMFSVVAIPETLRKTTLGSLAVGRQVNLELPLRAGDRLGGHFVNGHIDTVGRVQRRSTEAAETHLVVTFAREFARWALPQGSIAVDGVSLTVAQRMPEAVKVALIPETLKQTTLGRVREGDHVNLEFDSLVKAVVQTVHEQTAAASPVNVRLLTDAGW